MLPEERVHCEEANLQLLTSYDFSLDTQVHFSLTSAHPKSELLSFMARFGIVVAGEARGKHQSVISYPKKIVDNENNFLKEGGH